MDRRKAQAEMTFRARVWRQVEVELGRRGESKTQFAQRWGRTKSTVTRLAERDIPTTLSNMADLADALDMTLGEFLWPVVEPDATMQAARRVQRRAAERQAQAVSDAHERHITAYLAALDGDAAQRVLRLVGRLGRVAPADLDVLGHQLDGLVAAREREHPAEWPDLEEHDDGEHQ